MSNLLHEQLMAKVEIGYLKIDWLVLAFVVLVK